MSNLNGPEYLGFFAGLGLSLDKALARAFAAMMAWQGRQIEKARMETMSRRSLQDVGLERDRAGRLVRCNL
ncbi:hypothetical protein ACTL6U_06835 [Rhodovibrionaceae bacterium A322]